MLNILLLMAGQGSRFDDAGCTLPRPLFPVGGRPITEVLVRNVQSSCPHRSIFITLKEIICRDGVESPVGARLQNHHDL